MVLSMESSVEKNWSWRWSSHGKYTEISAMEINFPLTRCPLVSNESNLTISLIRRPERSSSMVVGGGDTASIHAA